MILIHICFFICENQTKHILKKEKIYAEFHVKYDFYISTKY